MSADRRTESYERALDLAEAGKHEDALASIQEHLKAEPKDGQGWNDAGAILYCLGRIDESITYFERARELCGDCAEICWNLAEAYIDGGHPSMVTRLFDVMEGMEILTADLINRTANLFLEQEYFGNAVETLLRSLEVSPEQEILEPMIEVVRSKRVKIAIFSQSQSESLDRVFEFISKRFITEIHTGRSINEIRDIMRWCDVAWFDGCDSMITTLSAESKVCDMILRIDDSDVNREDLRQVRWNNIDTLIMSGSESGKEVLRTKAAGIEKMTSVVDIPRGSDISGFATEKTRNRSQGKRIAWVGGINNNDNPMFLLQCMQKLNYIDADYRVYIAGEFEDASTERYVKYMVEELGLGNVVFFDGNVKDMKSWLCDKHYIASTSTGEPGIENVLKGMTCGLKPVVHNFPGADKYLPAEFLFNLSEQFCDQIISEMYEPGRYSDIAGETYSEKSEMKAINNVLFRFDKGMAERKRMKAAEPQNVSQPITVEATTVNRWEDSVAGADKPVTPVAIPIPQIVPKDMDIRIDGKLAPAGEVESNTVQDDSGTVFSENLDAASPSFGVGGKIDQMAAEVIRTSLALARNDSETDDSAGAEVLNDENADLSQMRHGSLDISAQEHKITQIANEFSNDIADTSEVKVRRERVKRVPFVK